MEGVERGAVDVLETEARLQRVALERGDAARRVVAFAAEGGERGGGVRGGDDVPVGGRRGRNASANASSCARLSEAPR